jgi:hypothetical protein
MGRTVNSFIKDLRYDKWFTVGYKFLNDVYVLCKDETGTVITFENISHNLPKGREVVKCESKLDAFKIQQKIPEIEIGGFERDTEIYSHSTIGEYV